MTAPPLQRQRVDGCGDVRPAGGPPPTPGRRSDRPPSVRQDPIASRLAALTGHLLVAVIALVGIGGATRVMEAGLACPDWPLCYGSLLPGRQMNLQVFLEWFHRLDAFVVGVGLLVLAAVSVLRRRELPGWQPPLALAGVVLVALQAGLGALTVVQLLPSGVVTAHLLTALVLVVLLSGSHQALRDRPALATAAGDGSAGLTIAVVAALLLLLAQCLLGGLMASQWAAGRCLSGGEACGWLLAHRLGARAAAAAVLAVAGLVAWRRPPARSLAASAGLLVLAQVALGVLSLRLTLAVPAVTVAHQVTAALLVAVLAALAVRCRRSLSDPLELSHV